MYQHRWILLLLVLLLAWVAPSMAATYYVATNGSDSNPCSQAQPCATIARGRSLLASGDTLYLRGGTYGQSINVTTNNNIPSGTSWETATVIAGYPGETVELTSGEIYPGIQFHFHTGGTQTFARYIIFKNFVITGNGSTGALGCGYPIDMNCGPHFIRWQDIEVSHTSDSSNGSGYGASDLQWIRVKVHHCGTARLDHCFYINSPRMLLDDVEAYESAGYGLQIYDTGCPLEGGVRRCADGTIIRNSRFHHNHGDGAVTLAHGENIQFYNNLVYNNDNGGLAGICYTAANVQVYNNTFYGNGGDAISVCAGVTNTTIRNNIMFGNTNTIQDLGTNTVQSNNLTSDPQFVSVTGTGATQFALTEGSPARNAGATIALVTTDRVGTPRPQEGAYDIGAMEYVGAGGVVQPPPPPEPKPRGVVTNLRLRQTP